MYMCIYIYLLLPALRARALAPKAMLSSSNWVYYWKNYYCPISRDIDKSKLSCLCLLLLACGGLIIRAPSGGLLRGECHLFFYSAPFRFSLCIHLVWGVAVCGGVFVCVVLLVLLFEGLWGFLLFVRLFLGLVFGSGFII